MFLFNSGVKASGVFRFLTAAVVIGMAVGFSGCGGGGGQSFMPNITDPTKATAITISPASGQSVSFSFPANAVAQAAQVSVRQIGAHSLPLSITRAARSRGFTPNAGNLYVYAFKMTVAPSTISQFNVPVTISGTGIVPGTVPANTILNLAYLQNEGQSSAAWNDVATFRTGTNGTFTQDLSTTVLPGIQQPGTYILYQPAAGTSASLANFGIALLADDTGMLQIINLYDSSGHVLPTPSLKGFQFAGATDLDGEALTPDGSYGILVDGGNTVRFFKGVQTGVPVASTASVDISNYGSDGDSVAIMPNGDTAIVAGDNNQLLIISGIIANNPQPADVITCPGARDGIVISNDGKTLLARGPGGLTVYSIAPTTPSAGSLGGQIAYTFTQVADNPELGQPTGEDGRDGMAFSPADSSHAVVEGSDSSGTPTLTLLTGLPNAPVARSMALRLPSSRGVAVRRSRPERHHRKATRVAITGASRLFAVAVTPDGKNAVIGTDTGLVLVSGVNTGTLAQVGSVYNPTFTGTDPTSTSSQTYNLGAVTTLAVTLDGKYVVAVSSSPSFGSMLLYPITPTGFGAQVSQLDGINIPGNDQILLH